MKLYKLDINRNVLEYYIGEDTDAEFPTVISYTGRLSGKKTHFATTLNATTDYIKRKVDEKINQGWSTLASLGLNEDLNNLEELLEIRLPYDQVDVNNRTKPQKAVLFKEGKFKYPGKLQPKLNGVRASIRWAKVINNEGLFAEEEERAIILSKEGLEYYLPHITEQFVRESFEYIDESGNIIDIVYDGELYNHDLPLNSIRASIPMVNRFGTISRPTGDPSKIQFWCYDLAIPKVEQDMRLAMKSELLNCFHTTYYPPDIPKDTIIVNLDHILVNDDDHALYVSNMFIDYRFEGGILRELNHFYGFGKRNSNMLKLKKWFYTKCVIVDIIQKNEQIINKQVRTYISVLLKNDLNDETFECTPEGDEEYRLRLLSDRDSIIGRSALVKYRERSGKKNVPFQGVIYKIEDYD
mgnify:CR=1 FL=1